MKLFKERVVFSHYEGKTKVSFVRDIKHDIAVLAIIVYVLFITFIFIYDSTY